MSQISTVNPATGEELVKYDPMGKEQVFQLVGKARRAFPEWKKDYEKRRSYIYNLVEYLKKHKIELAKVATSEMGKALKESIGEVEKCAWALEFYADHGDSFLSDEVLNTDARKSFLTFEEALEGMFKCPSCGKVLNLKKNDKSKKAYVKKIDEIRNDMQHTF